MIGCVGDEYTNLFCYCHFGDKLLRMNMGNSI